MRERASVTGSEKSSEGTSERCMQQNVDGVETQRWRHATNEELSACTVCRWRRRVGAQVGERRLCSVGFGLLIRCSVWPNVQGECMQCTISTKTRPGRTPTHQRGS